MSRCALSFLRKVMAGWNMPVATLGAVVLVIAFADSTLAGPGNQNGSDQHQVRIVINDSGATVRASDGGQSSGPAATFAKQGGDSWELLNATGDNGSNSHGFGYAVATDGDYAIVGAEFHDGFAGAAYIYKRDRKKWGVPQKLSAPDLGPNDHFGHVVSIDGDIAAVSATWQGLLEGAVYII